MGPFDVVPGGEVQLCRTLKLSNDKPMGVNRLQVSMAPGSHHFILFRSKKDFPDQVFPCWGTVNFDDWDFMMDVNQAGGADWQLPGGPDGQQGFILDPHQQIMVESHFVNASIVKSPDGGKAYLNLYEMPKEQVVHELHGMFTVNSRLNLPPKSDYTSSRLCTFSSTVKIVAMTGHFHQRGTRFEVDHVLDTVYPSAPTLPSPMIYESTSWDAPVFQIYDQPLLVNSDESLKFSCSYYNETDQPIGFGGHADVQEHCNLFFQYYMLNPGSPTCCAATKARAAGNRFAHAHQTCPHSR